MTPVKATAAPRPDVEGRSPRLVDLVDDAVVDEPHRLAGAEELRDLLVVEQLPEWYRNMIFAITAAVFGLGKLNGYKRK